MKENISNNMNPAKLFEEYEIPKDLTQPAEYPIECLGKILKNAALDIEKKVQLPVSIPALSVLVAAGFAIKGLAKIEHRNSHMQLALYVISVLKSGERKSTADKLALKPIRTIEEVLQDKYKENYREYEVDKDLHKSEKDRIHRDKALSKGEKKQALLDLVFPEKPKHGDLISQSPTSSSLLEILYDGHAIHGVMTDEAAQMLGGYSMSPDKMLSTLGLYTKLYDGSPVSYTVKGQRFTVKNSLLTVNLMMQPVVAEPLWSDSRMLEQGFLARFLFTYPDSIAGTRVDTDSHLHPQEGLEKYWAISESFLREYFDGEGCKSRILRLESGAKKVLDDCYLAIEVQLGVGKKLYNHAAMANRVTENMLRIAGIITLFDDPGASSVTVEVMRNAGHIMFYHFSEAIRLFELHRYNVHQGDAKLLLDWLIEQDRSVAHSEILQFGPNRIRDRKSSGLRELLEYMAQKGQVIKLPSGSVTYKGRKVSVAWEVVGI